MRIFFDENFSKYLALGISELQGGLSGEPISVLHIADFFGKGKKDEEWIPEIAKTHGIVITQDLRISRTQSLAAMCKQYKIGIFFVKPPKSFKYWDYVDFIVHRWQGIKEKARNTERPYAYVVTPRKFERIQL